MDPFLNPKEITARHRSELLAAAARVIGSGWFIHGREREAFEQEYRRLLAAHGLEASMSKPGNCHDKAALESFWSSFKSGPFHRQTFATRAHARGFIFGYVEVFPNRQRLHSALN